MSAHLQELVGFLHSPQPPARALALENVVPLANNDHSYLFKADNYTAVSDLKTLSKDKVIRIARLAFSTLINLCDDKDILENIASDNAYVQFVAATVVGLEQCNADLASMLLANLAKVDSVAEIFDWTLDTSEWIVEEVEGSNPFKSNKVMDCLVDCFVLGSERKLNPYANFDFLAFFFADISKSTQGRKYFTKVQAYDGLVPLSKLIPFTECESRIRRSGVANTIKNSLFEIDSHEMLITDEQVNLLPHILLPIAGPEDLREEEMFALPDELQLLPPDKKRDPEVTILKTYVECLLLLCTTKMLREYLREKGVYGLIRALHMATEDEDLQDVCDRLVQMLMRDEAPEDEKIQEIEEDEDDQVIEVL